MESAVIAVVRRMILDGLKQHPSSHAISPEMIATTVSWAIYGAAKEWVRTPNRCGSEGTVDTIALLVSPILALLDSTDPTDSMHSTNPNVHAAVNQ